MSGTVLVVEDDAPVREALGQTLELEGYSPVLAGSFVVAKDHISAAFDGVILSDIRMPGRDGLHLLDYARSVDPDLPVILLTGEGDIPMAVGAINSGAFDFLEKPCANDVLLDAVAKALRSRALVLENRRLNAQLTRRDAAARMIFGQSEQARALRDQVRKIARVAGAVLIHGAPGTGIAKVAEVIHALSPRADCGFVRVAGPGLSPGHLSELLAANAAGTVFIDEVPAMPGETQFTLLGALDDDGGARVLVGSSANPAAGEVPATQNPDLFYRLQALSVRIPSLHERPEDIPIIFREYVRQASEQAHVPEPAVTPDVIAGLMAQDWPGNSRALMNAATRFVLGLEGSGEGRALGLADKLAQVERRLIIDALQQNHGHASATARQLQLPRKTFYDKLSRHGIKPEDYR